LGKHNFTGITAVNAASATSYSSYDTPNNMANSAYSLLVMPAFGLWGSTDYLSLYLEPQFGLKVNQEAAIVKPDPKIGFGWQVYGEIYLTPIPSLEWYFEATVGNSFNEPVVMGTPYDAIGFEVSTGITWYLPDL